jgi:hypothetical protein
VPVETIIKIVDLPMSFSKSARTNKHEGSEIIQAAKTSQKSPIRNSEYDKVQSMIRFKTKDAPARWNAERCS